MSRWRARCALALAGELVPDAVNVEGGVIDEDVRPAIALAEKLGQVLHRAGRRRCPPSSTWRCAARSPRHDVKVLELAALKGVFADVVRGAGHLRQRAGAGGRPRRGRALADRAGEPRLPQPRHRARHARGRTTVAVSGTLTGPAARREARRKSTATTSRCRLTEHMAVLRYTDRPGVVGTVGRLLGEREGQHRRDAGGRDVAGGHALGVLAVDCALPPELLGEIAAAIGASQARVVDLSD